MIALLILIAMAMINMFSNTTPAMLAKVEAPISIGDFEVFGIILQGSNTLK